MLASDEDRGRIIYDLFIRQLPHRSGIASIEHCIDMILLPNDVPYVVKDTR
jgi:hypothetical protein